MKDCDQSLKSPVHETDDLRVYPVPVKSGALLHFTNATAGEYSISDRQGSLLIRGHIHAENHIEMPSWLRSGTYAPELHNGTVVRRCSILISD